MKLTADIVKKEWEHFNTYFQEFVKTQSYPLATIESTWNDVTEINGKKIAITICSSSYLFFVSFDTKVTYCCSYLYGTFLFHKEIRFYNINNEIHKIDVDSLTNETKIGETTIENFKFFDKLLTHYIDIPQDDILHIEEFDYRKRKFKILFGKMDILNKFNDAIYLDKKNNIIMRPRAKYNKNTQARSKRDRFVIEISVVNQNTIIPILKDYEREYTIKMGVWTKRIGKLYREQQLVPIQIEEIEKRVC
jgi:hypothetical protein